MAILLALAARVVADGGANGRYGCGPGTDIGARGWFLGVWVVMMAAMMFPSLASTVALYARMKSGVDRALLFAGGCLLVWGGAGLGAYGLYRIGRDLFGGDLAWHAGGRWFAAGVLALAAAYELTPLKDVCLAKCRSPTEFLLGSWRDGRPGALEMGSDDDWRRRRGSRQAHRRPPRRGFGRPAHKRCVAREKQDPAAIGLCARGVSTAALGSARD